MSGAREVRIVGGEIEVVVLPEMGARLHRLRVRGTDLIRTPSDIEEHVREPFFWGGFVMAPWCGRLAPGPVRVGDRQIELAPNFRDGTAIHGQVYAVPWQQVGESTFAIEAGGDGWPWRYRLEMQLAVASKSVTIVQTLTNLDDVPMPGGIGLHPWFRVPVEAAIHADTVHASNTHSTPSPEPVSGDLDMRRQRAIAAGVDATWPDPADPPLELFWPEHDLRATIRAPFPSLHITAVYAPERRAIATEPQTHAPQGLRRLLNHEPGALTLIEPGAAIELPITIEFRALS